MTRSLPATSMPRRFNSFAIGTANGCRFCTRIIMSCGSYLPPANNVSILSAISRMYSLRAISVCLSPGVHSPCNSTAPTSPTRKHLCGLFTKPVRAATFSFPKNISTVCNIGSTERKLCVRGTSRIWRALFLIWADICSRLAANACGSAPWNP